MNKPTSNAIADRGLLERIEAIKNLPTLPEIYNRLMSELSKPEVAMNQLAKIISHDVAISAKVLQVVNSAYFAMPRKIENMLQALNILGFETVKGIVLAAGIYQADGLTKVQGFLPQEIYGRAIGVGTKARFLAYSFDLDRTAVDEALTAGLLHDVGKLVLLTSFADEFKKSLERSISEAIPLYEAEEKELGVNDAAIGAFLLTNWGIPQQIIDAVAMHYAPSKWGNRTLDVGAAVHLAYASEQDRNHAHTKGSPSAFDLAFTNALGISDQIASLVDMSPEAIS